MTGAAAHSLRLAPPAGDRPALCVLASGSAGNCSALHIPGEGVWLVDLGLSPRRTRCFLESMGLGMADVRGALVTHLDHDHLHSGWSKAWPEHAPAILHEGHARGARARLPRGRIEALSGSLEAGAFRVRSALAPHDERGACVFRIDLPAGAGGAALGYATDVGRCGGQMIELLSGVDTLAIESNYCPRLQLRSGRPAQLRHRIMGGAGHLSNQQCRDAIAAIGPRQRVILLHLSRDCNHPALARRVHDGARYELVITSQTRHTGWLAIEPRGPAEAPATRCTQASGAPRQLGLFAEAL
jgi:phosphoribosyl 1,2-cyclic phosphodiesterase